MADNLIELDIFIKRLKKIGIEITCIGNYPWIYLDTVNGNKVKEKYESEHAFTIAFLPVRADRPFVFTNLKYIFEIIRNYGKGAEHS